MPEQATTNNFFSNKRLLGKYRVIPQNEGIKTVQPGSLDTTFEIYGSAKKLKSRLNSATTRDKVKTTNTAGLNKKLSIPTLNLKSSIGSFKTVTAAPT